MRKMLKHNKTSTMNSKLCLKLVFHIGSSDQRIKPQDSTAAVLDRQSQNNNLNPVDKLSAHLKNSVESRELGQIWAREPLNS